MRILLRHSSRKAGIPGNTSSCCRSGSCRIRLAQARTTSPCCLASSSSRNLLEKIAVSSRRTLASKASDDDGDDDGSLQLLESFANLDHGRSRRTGFPEAVFAEGKTPNQVARILDDMARSANEELLRGGGAGDRGETTNNAAILATRVTADMFKELSRYDFAHGSIEYHEVARIATMKAKALDADAAYGEERPPPKKCRMVVATAGTTDLPVAEEAAVTLEAAGVDVDRVYDAGVAGLHRIVSALPRLRHPDVSCVVVAAGMDGALPSVVGGLVSVPVIAVPTSVGYGASFGGVSALLTMLNSCSPGVGVVNIDNGFGAAALAYKCSGLGRR